MASRYSSEILAVITADEWDASPIADVLRVALYGGLYEDTTNPSGAAVHYQGRIKSDVVFDKKLGVVFWKEESEIDFGYIDLAIEDQDADIIDFAKSVTIATVDLYRVNTNDPNEVQLELLAAARTSDIGFVDERTVRFRLESALQGEFDAPINVLYYDAAYPQLEGKPYPIAWAFTTDPEQLLPTVFVDAVHLLYHVTDLEISSFESFVYDRGIELSESTGTGFTATTNGFLLNQNPDGKITAGQILLVDPEDTANDFKGLFRFVRLAMTRAGIWNNVNEPELTGLMNNVNMGEVFPQFFTQQVVSLEGFLGELLDGVGGWYYVDELAEIHFGLLTDPDVTTPTLNFTDTNVIGEIKVEDDKAPGLSTRISHGENPGAYEQEEIAGGVTTGDRLAMTNADYVNETTQPVISFYGKAAAREPIKLALAYTEAVDVGAVWTADSVIITADETVPTADGYWGTFGTKTSGELALLEVNRWWSDLYPLRRRFYTFAVQINDPLFDDIPLPGLGDFCTLQSDRFRLLETAKNLLIRRVRFNFSDNLLTIEGWG